jgi:hypothetical protein
MAISAFGKAFSEARKSGEKEFTFNGKKYNTKLASDVESNPNGAKFGEYKPRDSYQRRGENATSANYVPRDNYVRSGKKSFDTETENVPPDMSNYKPRREPKPLTEVTKPGTNTNYENNETSEVTFKKGGKVSSASKRADGIAQRGKTRGKMVMCGGGRV